jgi:hypothetical protein
VIPIGAASHPHHSIPRLQGTRIAVARNLVNARRLSATNQRVLGPTVVSVGSVVSCRDGAKTLFAIRISSIGQERINSVRDSVVAAGGSGEIHEQRCFRASHLAERATALLPTFGTRKFDNTIVPADADFEGPKQYCSCRFFLEDSQTALIQRVMISRGRNNLVAGGPRFKPRKQRCSGDSMSENAETTLSPQHTNPDIGNKAGAVTLVYL